MELVSVLLPVYNVEKYIKESVNSILKQTYRDIEIIIVDDCSTDNTYSILHKIQKTDERIKLYRNSKNLKIAETLNIALKNSKGNYICRMDGDDISLENRIEKKLNYLKKNPNIDLVGCSVKSINEKGEILGYKKMISDEAILNKTLKYASPVFHIWLARREVYKKLYGYRNIPYVEDYDFLLRVTSLGYKYTNMNEYYGYSIRLRKGNTISSVGIIQRKAHRYCYELYQKRCQGSDDDFSLENFNKYVKTRPLENILFNKSNYLLQRALNINKRFSIKKILLVIISYLLSKEQRRYINGKVIILFETKLYAN